MEQEETRAGYIRRRLLEAETPEDVKRIRGNSLRKHLS
jgi:hypothetical protein